MLYIVATPIGNKEDITLRSLRLLQETNYIIAEDTRMAKKLLNLYDISSDGKQFFSLTSFTQDKQLAQYVELIQNSDVVLVSDAGTPGLSDPGKILIKLCHEHILPYSVLPGANALVPAVVASGFDTSSFVFIGFLPKKKGKQTLMKEIIAADRPYILYESVHRVHKVLQELYNLWFRGQVSIARELSKMHEQCLTDTIEKVLDMFTLGHIPLKGEFVVWLYPIR
jgi:16S rRNA (cytidine1402-2'-O)-methyltransferase